jgi:hypothetical protein
MVTRGLWELEMQFESDITDQYNEWTILEGAFKNLTIPLIHTWRCINAPIGS